MKTSLFGAAVALTFASVAFADGLSVTDPYARASAMMSTSGAAFMVLHNDTDTDDTLIAARADGVAERIELHTHIEDENGVMQMREVEGGIPVPAHGMTELKRGGLHVMFLGITEPFEQGDMIDLTLVFEHGGEVEIDVPVDLERKEGDMAPMDHSTMNHGEMDHSKMDHGQMQTAPATSSN
ncbi:MAG: copper-binding protein [Rhodobacterales bacterium]|nr:MAG: copper-binding protein [Rhodobacterales bacterium]